MSHIVVPPHLISLPDVVHHFKRKFYHKYTVSLFKLPVLLVVITCSRIILQVAGRGNG
jgi:hypothetical protein